jgi:hypothetical protein
MPNAVVQSYAEKTKKSVAHVEKLWDEAKKSADKTFDGKKGPRYWTYVNGIVKKRLKITESFTFKEYVDLTQPEVTPMSVVQQDGPAPADPTEDYARFISCLFAARDKAHELHLGTKFYTKHVALNELYELLLEFADQLAETFQGKHGVLNINIPAADMFNQPDEVSFAVALTDWLNGPARSLIGTDDFIINIFEELLGEIYRIKYKLENLQ